MVEEDLAANINRRISKLRRRRLRLLQLVGLAYLVLLLGPSAYSVLTLFGSDLPPFESANFG
jgi:hypothetical protein